MSYYIQSWQLTEHKSIHITRKNTLTFRHEAKRHGCFRGVTIPLSAVSILKDFANIVEKDPTLFRMPVDGKVWIEHKHGMVKLTVCSSKHEGVDYRFFRFTSNMWKDFIKHILPQIISFVDNNDYGTGGRCESYVDDKDCNKIESEGRRIENSRKRRVHSSWKTDETCNKSSKWAANDADMESEN